MTTDDNSTNLFRPRVSHAPEPQEKPKHRRLRLNGQSRAILAGVCGGRHFDSGDRAGAV